MGIGFSTKIMGLFTGNDKINSQKALDELNQTLRNDIEEFNSFTSHLKALSPALKKENLKLNMDLNLKSKGGGSDIQDKLMRIIVSEDKAEHNSNAEILRNATISISNINKLKGDLSSLQKTAKKTQDIDKNKASFDGNHYNFRQAEQDQKQVRVYLDNMRVRLGYKPLDQKRFSERNYEK